MILKLKQVKKGQYLRNTVDDIKKVIAKEDRLIKVSQKVNIPSKVITLLYKPEKGKNIKLLVNGLKYCEGKDFTVDYENKTLLWHDDNGFKIEIDDEMEVIYFTQDERNDDILTDKQLISCGTAHNIIIKMGTAWSWGDNDYGQLGLGHTNDVTNASRIGNLRNIVSLSGGCYHNVALLEDGTVWAWGYNNSGQLGLGHNDNVLVPTKIEISDVIQIECGQYHTVALKKDGTVWAWGLNSMGQLGIGDTINSNVPKQVLGINDAARLFIGMYNNMVLKRDGKLYGWGNNYSGQLGVGHFNNCVVPELINNIGFIRDIVNTLDNTYFLLENGDLYSCGDNYYKQLGYKSLENKVCVPLKVDSVNNIFKLVTSTYHVVALDKSGIVYSWGRNQVGQLGIGRRSNHVSVPTKIDSLSDIVDISCGDNFTAFLDGKRDLYVCGDNTYGQFGNDTSISCETPIKNPYFSNNIEQISCGYSHMMVSLNDNTIWAWGLNSDGQLGDKDIEFSLRPIKIKNITLN